MPLATLEHVSPVWAASARVWRARCNEAGAVPHSRHVTAFSHLALTTFDRLARMGSPDGAVTPTASSPKALVHALRPLYAYRATGLLQAVLHGLAERNEFTDYESEQHVQAILLYVDARRAPALPHKIVCRLAKTVTRTAWHGMPYMWKIATAPHMPGFPLYRLSPSLLARIVDVARDDTEMFTLIHAAISHRLAELLQRGRVRMTRRREEEGNDVCLECDDDL